MSWTLLVEPIDTYLQQPLTVYLGNMMGTSCDGLADFTAAVFEPVSGKPLCYCSASMAVPKTLQAELLAASKKSFANAASPKSQFDALAEQLSHFLLTAFPQVIDEMGLTALPKTQCVLSPHGVTVDHQPWATPPRTLQIIHAEKLLQLGYNVVTDHRQTALHVSSAAPLAPVLIRQCFEDPKQHTVVVNGGGIANICTLLTQPDRKLLAWDIGPANSTSDAIVQHVVATDPQAIPPELRAAILKHGFDVSGHWAARGTVNENLLTHLQRHEYFQRQRQFKSADRASFGLDWVLPAFEQTKLSWADCLATVNECVACRIADAIQTSLTPSNAPVRLFCYGGFTHNEFLMQRLHTQVLQHDCNYEFINLAALDLDPNNFEALLMAYLGFCTDQTRAIDLSYCRREDVSPAAAKAIPGRMLKADNANTARLPLNQFIQTSALSFRAN